MSIARLVSAFPRLPSSRGLVSALVVVTATFCATGCDNVPSELQPLFNPVTDLRGLPDGEERIFDMVVRNLGTNPVSISSVAVAELSGREGEDASFTAQMADDTIEGGAESVLRIIYQTPNGASQAAIVRIQSDAEVNPELNIEVVTNEFVTRPPTDAGPNDDAGVETDAGGDVDAGADPDAGAPTDAGGEPDAGTTDDAGPSTDAGGGDAGSVDAGEVDAGSSDAGASDAGATDAG